MFSWYRQWNNFENLSIFDVVKAYDVKAYKRVCPLFGPPVYDFWAWKRKEEKKNFIHHEHDQPISSCSSCTCSSCQADGKAAKLPTPAIYRVAPKMAHFLYAVTSYALTSSNINRFSNLSTIWIRRKFVIILSLKIQPHPKCAATLPCEMSVSWKQQAHFCNNAF